MAKTIVVTGKGGVGKTVVSALMIRYLKERASGAVLAIDADPDSNLPAVLDVPVHQTLGDIREGTLTDIRKLPSGMDKAAYIEAGLHETLVETPKVDFLVMGRPEGPGCYCYVNNLLRKFADDLLPSYEWIVTDSEAGMEHLSRRTATNIDHLVVVVNENPQSVACARRISEVIASVRNEVRSRRLLVNNVPQDRVESVREKASELGFDFLGHIPHDDALEKALFEGRSLYDLEDGGAATSKMNEVMERLGA